VPILNAERLFPGPSFLAPRIGPIYQRFAPPVEGRGAVSNVVRFSVPPFLEESTGATFTVGASYEVRSGKRIALVFEEASLGDLRITPLAEALIAPAMLPRGSLQQAALLALKEGALRVPLRGAAAAGRAIGGAGYLLSYLDKDTLIGRAVGSGGSFIFSRAQEEAPAAPAW
jgi:hypothetical protein